jgi:hypothetical protein
MLKVRRPNGGEFILLPSPEHARRASHSGRAIEGLCGGVDHLHHALTERNDH